MANSDGRHKKIIECFVSMPFTSEFDRVYLNGICSVTPQLPKWHLQIVRLDKQVYERRNIEENVLKHIDRSDLLIADITRYKESLLPNVSVMHEIGYACGKQVPFILIGQKGTHDNLPSNIGGSLVIEYDVLTDPQFIQFSAALARQMDRIIETEVVDKVRGEFRVECFSERHGINIPRLIRKAKRRIYILTTNLDYTLLHLREAIIDALGSNADVSAFRVEILTMNPESDVANARAIQLGRDVRQYRNELRKSLDDMREAFGNEPRVEIITYRTLPTQMTFIIDDVVITGIVALSQQSREGVHFVLDHLPDVTASFLAHFRALKTLAVANP